MKINPSPSAVILKSIEADVTLNVVLSLNDADNPAPPHFNRPNLSSEALASIITVDAVS